MCTCSLTRWGPVSQIPYFFWAVNSDTHTYRYNLKCSLAKWGPQYITTLILRHRFCFKKFAFLEICMEWKPFCAHLPKLRSILVLSPLKFSFPLLDQLQWKCPRKRTLLYQHSFLLFHSHFISSSTMYKINQMITNFTQCKGNVDSII